MRYTVLLLPETDPDVYVAYVPVLGVTTQGGTREEALVAAREAAVLALRGMLEDDEEIPNEPPGAITASIEISVPAVLAVA